MSIVLLGSTSGSCTLQEQAVAGTSVLTLPVGTGTVVANNVNSAIVSGTAVASTSGTSIDFTSIPSWVKRISVLFNGVSLNGNTQILVQIGAGSITSSGYNSGGSRTTTVVTSAGSTAGFVINSNTAGEGISGVMQITNLTSNLWVQSHSGGFNAGPAGFSGGGTVTLGGALDRIRITTVNGTDTFDAGSINILYE
jgi:hypothetical protein